MTASPATVRNDDRCLVMGGPLVRSAVAALWPRLATVGEVKTVDISAVEEIDSAGLACLALLASRHPGMTVVGLPRGYPELRAAYRLGEQLTFAD